MYSIFYGQLGEYGFNHTTFSLSNDIRYNTRVSLDSTRLIITCGYNNRTKLRWIRIETTSGDILLRNTPLKFGRQCELLPISRDYNLNYFVTLKAKKPLSSSVSIFDGYDYLNWSKDFDLCFVGMPYSSVLNLKDEYLNIKMGGRDG